MNKTHYVLVFWPEAQQFIGCNQGTHPAEEGGYFVELPLYEIGKANPNINGEALEVLLALQEKDESRML